MSYLDGPEVTAKPDGTYTITGDPAGTWVLRDTGAGWEATHPDDGFEGLLWASAEDAAHAVLGNPGTARRWGS